MNEWQVLGRASEANYDQSGRKAPEQRDVV
jgi:hypothetical protein